jgi:hypothetical protein
MQSDLSSDGACSRVVKDLSDFCLSTGSRHTLGKNSGQVNNQSEINLGDRKAQHGQSNERHSHIKNELMIEESPDEGVPLAGRNCKVSVGKSQFQSNKKIKISASPLIKLQPQLIKLFGSSKPVFASENSI